MDASNIDPRTLVAQFGNQAAVARAFGVSRMAVTLWIQAGRLPAARLWQLQAGAVKPPEKPSEAVTGQHNG